MDIKDIDNKVAAAVLRRHQEIGAEQTTRLVVASLKGVPEPLIQKTVTLCHLIQQESIPEMNSIMEKLENGEVNFDDTVIALMDFGMRLAREASKRAQQLVFDQMDLELKEEELPSLAPPDKQMLN